MLKAWFDVYTLLDEDVKKAMKRTIYAFTQAGITYDLIVTLGDPSSEVAEIAKKEEADLIIIGSRELRR